MAVKNFVLGMEAKFYLGDAGAELTAMTEMDNAKDVNVTMETGEADVTTRANSGWRATAATVRECTVEFEMLWKPGDDGFDAILAAYLSAGEVEMAPLTGAKDAAGSAGPKGSFTITNFSRKEPLEEAITVLVTAKMSKFDEWVSVAGS